jgi:hypothetical protein
MLLNVHIDMQNTVLHSTTLIECLMCVLFLVHDQDFRRWAGGPWEPQQLAPPASLNGIAQSYKMERDFMAAHRRRSMRMSNGRARYCPSVTHL